jgi:hypothetical protein
VLEAHTEAPTKKWRSLFEERVANYELVGRYTREEAERLAWDELENRWHVEHGERVPRDLCTGCRTPIGEAEALDLIDGNRVHFANNACLIRHGDRWRSAATQALAAMGLKPPAGDYGEGKKRETPGPEIRPAPL